jgi:hypothetical protein
LLDRNVRKVVGPSGLLIAIIGYRSFVVSVLIGLGKKKKRETNPGFGKYCVPLPYSQSTYGVALRMILATTEGVFAFHSSDFTTF